MAEKVIEIYTDGACSQNPGPGGWAALLVYDGKEKIVTGAVADTTNNRMELSAAVGGLSAVEHDSPIHVITDSMYVHGGITGWLEKWKQNGWITSDRKAVKNEDLWRQLDELVARLEVEWFWVKAHSGHPYNDRVDALARKALQEILVDPFEVEESGSES